MENACKSAQNLSFDEAAQATIQEEPNHVSPRTHGFASSRARGIVIRDGWMDTDGHDVKEELGLVCFQSSHQRSQSRCFWCVLARKAQTNTEASRDFKQVKADCDGDYKWAKEYR